MINDVKGHIFREKYHTFYLYAQTSAQNPEDQFHYINYKNVYVIFYIGENKSFFIYLQNILNF